MSRHGVLSGVLTAYRNERDSAEDERWAQEAATTLALEGVGGAAIRWELEDALELVRGSGEGPAELYGDARAWAFARLREAPEEGRVLVDETPDTSWRDALVVGCVVAAVLTLALMVMVLLKDGWRTGYAWGWVLFPLVSGVMCTLSLAVWERALLRRPRWQAVVAAGAVVVVGVPALTWLVMEGDRVVVTTSSFGWGAVALAYGMLAALLERVLPERPGRRSRPVDDDAWERQLAGTLRLRMDLPEVRVRDVVKEARAHAQEAGRALAVEFGDPAAYAARFEPDRAARLRRRAWARTALVPLALVVAFAGVLEEPSPGWSGVSWAGLVMLVVASWMTYDAWRAVRRGRA